MYTIPTLLTLFGVLAVGMSGAYWTGRRHGCQKGYDRACRASDTGELQRGGEWW